MRAREAGSALRSEVTIPVQGDQTSGTISVPRHARGVVLFAHGSGSSRHSPRNRMIADALEVLGLATLLVDLLTPDEAREDEQTGALRFDTGLLTARVLDGIAWLEREARNLPIGLFGASTGAAAALAAAADRPDSVRAVVSRGGRPDLAGAALGDVQAPTLLIVGGADPEVLTLNRQAFEALRCEKRLSVVPGATHLFEEPGALEEVARLAGTWLLRYVPTDGRDAVNGARAR